jgi:flagellar export protein FliJ
MPRDPLLPLLRLRRLAVDEARRDLAACLRADEEAETAERAAAFAIHREQAAAASLEAGDAAVEAFAAWLPVGRAALEQARLGRAAAEAATVRARLALGTARSASEAAGRMLQVRDGRLRAGQARRDQAALDEAARPGFPRGRR